MNDDHSPHLPPDLENLGEALKAHRDAPDGHLLERVLHRIEGSTPARPRLFGFGRMRLASALVIVMCLGMNVTGALASVLTACGLSSSSAHSIDISSLISSATKLISTGTYSQSAADNVYCQQGGSAGSDDNSQGGSETNSPQVVTSSPTTSKVNGKSVTTYTQTTTKTTDSSGSEQNGGGGSCGCQTSAGTPSEDVYTTIATFVNGKLSSTTNTDTKQSDGSESNSSCGGTVEKPGCGNEQNNGISGSSGDHGGQPPKSEERGQCPHSPGVDGS